MDGGLPLEASMDDSTRAADLAQPSSEPHEGWLEKQRGGHNTDKVRHMVSALLQGWQWRYCLLMRPVLTYYASEEDVIQGKISGTVVVAHSTCERVDERKFVVHTASRKLTLRAPSSVEADAWCACFTATDKLTKRFEEAQRGGRIGGSTPSWEDIPSMAGNTIGEHRPDETWAAQQQPPPPAEVDDTDPSPSDNDDNGGGDEDSELNRWQWRKLQMYTQPESLYELLRAPSAMPAPVKLLKWSFLSERANLILSAGDDQDARRRLALPRRQDLEATHPEAFYTVAEVMSLKRGNNQFAGGPLSIVSVSHVWETAEHPDPFGHTLCRLVAAIRHSQATIVGTHNVKLPEELAIFFDVRAQKHRASNRVPAYREPYREPRYHSLSTISLARCCLAVGVVASAWR